MAYFFGLSVSSFVGRVDIGVCFSRVTKEVENLCFGLFGCFDGFVHVLYFPSRSESSYAREFYVANLIE